MTRRRQMPGGSLPYIHIHRRDCAHMLSTRRGGDCAADRRLFMLRGLVQTRENPRGRGPV